MQPATSQAAVNHSNLPDLCIPIICRHLGQGGATPIVRVRAVNHAFHDQSRKALAEAIHEELTQVDHIRVQDAETRLALFRRSLRLLDAKEYLPQHSRLPLLQQLCRIVNTLPGQLFTAAWTAMVARFNAESDTLRSQLQPAMDKCAGRVELYGDGGARFTFKTPAW